MNIGIFPGSFNPIHIGHLALANWMSEFCDVDEVWFLVTPQNPLKRDTTLLDEKKRLEMVEASIAGYPKFRVNDIEFSLPRPSYTIHTLRALQQKYPDNVFHLIMGADSWCSIHKWKAYKSILEEFPMLIYPRNGYDVIIPEPYTHIKKVDAPLMEVSSTFIRQVLQNGKDIRFFLPEAIRNKLIDN